MIQKQFNAVLEYSQEISKVNTDELFSKWEEAKKPFINLFGGKLIYEHPEKITFELDEDSKIQRFNNFIEYVSELGINVEFYHFLSSFTWRDFYANSLSQDYQLKNGKTIAAGTKMIKAFKYFLKDKILLNEVQSKASELIQENKISGTLCFSVHPLDFLSLSENNYNWRSCHSLDGEYRAGNLSYMIDSTTMICYLKGPEDVQLKHFPEGLLWNNKKWRCLLFVSERKKAVFAGRQYPVFTTGSLDAMRDLFISLMPKDHRDWSPWYHEYLETYTYADGTVSELPHNTYVPINNEIYKMRDIIINEPGSRMFNDLLESSCYVPYYMFENSWDYHIKFPIGGETKCIHCGERDITCGDTMLCNSCIEEYGPIGEFYYCDCCGSLIHSEDDRYYIGDDILCEDCYNRHTFQCGKCGYQDYNSNKHRSEAEKCFICNDCWEEEALACLEDK